VTFVDKIKQSCFGSKSFSGIIPKAKNALKEQVNAFEVE